MLKTRYFLEKSCKYCSSVGSSAPQTPVGLRRLGPSATGDWGYAVMLLQLYTNA